MRDSSPEGERARPQALRFDQKLSRSAALSQKAGAANAVFLHDPIRENGVQKRPQAFLNPEI